jgi:hypothetical protein
VLYKENRCRTLLDLLILCPPTCPAGSSPRGVVAALVIVEYAMRTNAGQEQDPAEQAGGELIAHEQTEHQA